MRSVHLATIRGIQVRAHWSLVVVVALLTATLATAALPNAADGHASLTYWLVAAATSITFLASITAHEMAHSLVAQHRGVGVTSITLWLLGGVAELEQRARSWRDELAIALAGPATSAGVAVCGWAAALAVWAVNGPDLVVAALGWLASTNLIIAVFNLLPGAPLDGGRVLAAIRWRGHGSADRAREEAARAGVVIGQAMIAGGVALLFVGLGGSGLWLALLGWFLAGAARAEFTDVETRHVLDNVTVAEVMTPRPAVVPETMTLETLVGCVLPKIHGSTVPVVRDGHLRGLITPEQLRRVAPGDWRHRTTAEVATPASDVVVASPQELLLDAIDRLDETHRRIVVVTPDEHVVGLITPTDIARAVQLARLRSALAA